ncbi:electron transporter RnfE [Rugosibacter aromaticivorans]|uniref:Electron transporter RnfE n=1 Tax=Rugosibacter aromaticivorans TaxID=1565605 RepID=A0A0C5JLF7_9PROT|nr:SHOCT domain-containing protein [Rugosibacter aromaticivorans]AJP48201.1 electron transporter RnfE [Rugosibacter aromaticivorans]TBR14888.1 MAG: SHOCT domain-containing protein [Rugosibacter sp.]
MNYAGGSGWMGLGWIFMILVWVLIILGVVALVRWLGTGSRDRHEAQRKTPLEILQERYARGEIEREEYEQKRRDLA